MNKIVVVERMKEISRIYCMITAILVVFLLFICCVYIMLLLAATGYFVFSEQFEQNSLNLN